MQDIARIALGGDAVQLFARDIGYRQIGALLGIETPAAIYVGTLWGVSVFDTTIYIKLRRDGSESQATVKPDQVVWVAPQPTEPAEHRHKCVLPEPHPAYLCLCACGVKYLAHEPTDQDHPDGSGA